MFKIGMFICTCLRTEHHSVNKLFFSLGNNSELFFYFIVGNGVKPSFYKPVFKFIIIFLKEKTTVSEGFFCLFLKHNVINNFHCNCCYVTHSYII